MRMKKTLSIVLVSVLIASMVSILTPKVMGWSFGLHGRMARDSLRGLGWDDEQIGNIAWYANEIDITLPHCTSANHRVEKFQEEFEKYGGDVCALAGAEFSAWIHISEARELYAAGNNDEAERHLGYAIHFIQDAVSPSHVFPFQEGAHSNFETYTLARYEISNDWELLVGRATIEPISFAEDLRDNVVEAAEWVNETFQAPRLSYRRQDGVEVGELSWLDSSKLSGWKMSVADIGICMEKASSLVKGAAIWATALQKGVKENYVPIGCAFMNFEDGTDGEAIRSTIPGLRFTTTLGYNWVYGDIRTGQYNVYPYGHQGYECNNNFFAWLGPNMGQGRIDFVLGPASYFSVLTSTYSGVTIDAYDSDDNLIASSGWATNNLNTRTFTRVSVQKPGMAYVIVHDTGNYWLIDDIVTDAPTLGSDVSSESVKKIPHRIEISLIDGDWTTPNSKIGVYIYDISMRAASLITELTPQIADNLVVSFTAVLKDRDGDGTVTADEIRENIQEQIPLLMAKEYVKFINEQIGYLGLPPPPADYGTNLLNQIFDFTRSVYNVASTYTPYVLAIVAIPATIATAVPLTTYGVGGFQAVTTGIYVPTHGLIGTDGEKMATMYSLGDLEIVDSEGRIVCKAFSQIPGASYIQEDLNDDGVSDDTIVLPAEVRMDYVIRIIPDETAQPTDTFTLSLGSLGICFSLVSELSFSEIPEDGYGLHSTPSPRDNTPPEISVEVPSPGDAVQDGITLEAIVSDPSGVDWVTFSIREPDGTMIDPMFESMQATHIGDDTWTLSFDTTQRPDGYYLFMVNASDMLGNEGYKTADFSIRNWACLELLPASESNKAKRTMPVKFSLRVVEAVDPTQPFVYNEELTIVIYEEGDPDEILQISTYGDTARDYRINPENELYITNFRTLRKKLTTYVVEIYRKGMLIGSFTFETVK